MTGPANVPEVHILQAKDVSIPIVPSAPPDLPPEILKLRSDFLAGKKLSPEDMGSLLRQTAETGGGGNGNCNIC